jgi:hypothetical protein
MRAWTVLCSPGVGISGCLCADLGLALKVLVQGVEMNVAAAAISCAMIFCAGFSFGQPVIFA